MTTLELIRASISGLSREVDVPTGPLGYGTDLSCVQDLTERLDEVDPFSVEGIAESLIRRFTVQRGLIQDLPNDGLDLRTFLNRGSTASDLTAMQGQIASEAHKDDRVSRAVVTVTFPTLRQMRVDLRVTPNDPSLSSFTLTLAVTDAGVLSEALS